MPTELATVLAADDAASTLQLIGNGATVTAVPSPTLRALWIILHPDDLVTVDLATDPPQVMYRWWRTTAIAVDGDRITIDPPPSGLQRDPVALMPPDPTFVVQPGDKIVCSRTRVVDIERNGRPVHPELFVAAYARAEPNTTGPYACLRLPAEDPPIDAGLIRRLLRSQFPQFAHLRLERIDAWENAMFRLGDELAVRLTRGRWALGQLETEHQWVPILASRVPLPIPVPLELGAPGEGCPWSWSVRTWLDGERATRDRLTRQHASAVVLAEFLAAFQSIEAAGGPIVGTPPYWFGWTPLAEQEVRLRRVMHGRDERQRRAMERIWEDGIAAEADWDGTYVWLHGDLDPSNVLAREGCISGIIDFGCMSTGDRAYDYSAAWRLLGRDARRSFRDALGIHDASWARARAWALTTVPDEVLTDASGGD